MSGLGTPPLRVASPEVMNKILLRSSTPASNEKVLLYLEGMQSDPPAPDDRETNASASPRSQTVPARITSPMLKGSNSGGSGARRSGRSELSYVTDKRQNGLGLNGIPPTEHDNEFRSDVQEGRDSEAGAPVPIRITAHVEPGPQDGPGVRYESLGSSFGNMGQPPWDQHVSPNKAAGVPLPSSAPSSNHPTDHNPFQSFGMTPALKTGVTNGRVQSPVNGSKLSQTASKQKAPSNRAKSPVNDAERPWSPRSAAPSQNQSRATHKTSRGTESGTKYPPLPESRVESRAEGHRQDSEVGPLPPFNSGRSKSQGGHGLSRAPSKVSTLAPSDSPSMAGLKYYKKKAAQLEQELQEKEQAVAALSIKSPKSQGQPVPSLMSPKSPTVRAMSPRQQVTQEDFLQVASALSPRTAPQMNGHSHSHISGSNGHQHHGHEEQSPVQSRTQSQVDEELDEEEEEMVRTILSRTPRTSMALSALEPDIHNSHFHDMELCELLHSLDAPNLPEVVKKAVRKAVRARVKKLGMKSDNESIRQYRKSFHDHDPRVHLQPNFVPELSERSEPPDWARELMQGMHAMQQRLDNMAPKIERMKLSRTGSIINSKRQVPPSELDDGGQAYMNGVGTIGDESVYQPDTGIMDPTTVPPSTHEDGSVRDEEEYGDGEEDERYRYLQQEALAHTRGLADDYMAGARNDSPGRQFLEEELYKLRVKTGPGSAVGTHKTWEVAREDGDYDYEGEAQAAVTESGIPEIPDTTVRQGSPSLPALPQSESGGEMVHMPEPHWTHQGYGSDVQHQTPPWQLIHQRLLNWAIIWPMSELDAAVGSATRGHQVDEISLSIWATQSYKRYVRSRMTDSPQGRVDRLFVPPNVADAISTAVFNGRHGDACMMLRDLWAPFGLDGIPRLLIVLAKHRADENHWVVHRFSLPDGQLTTYDTYPDKCLPDGRPLGWWFAIRIAWPDANYPSPDNLMQKMVRLHRPMQLGIDNSVAAAGIWRNLLMGSRAERSVDLERLRELIHTEVKNLRQRKLMGKLSIGQPKPGWDDMN